MLQRRRSRREARRENQRRYEARQRAGIGLYPVPLGCREIDLLIALGWLPEGEEGNRERVGEAVANALRAIIADR
jgi:hypothetical protein